MSRKVVVLVLALLGAGVVGVAGASAWVGKTVMGRLSQQTAAVTHMLPGLKVEEEISSGVFSSTRRVKIRLGCAPVPTPDKGINPVPLELSWRDQIQHGPFPGGKTFAAAVIESELYLGDAWVKQIKQIAGSSSNQPMLTAHTRIALGGAFTSDVSVPRLELKDTMDRKGEWSGMKVHVQGQMPAGGGQRAGTLSYVASIEPFSLVVDTEEGSFALRAGDAHMTVSAQLDPNATSLVLPFKSDTQIASILISAKSGRGQSPSDKPFELTMSKLTAKSESTVDKELWSVSSSVGGSLNVNGFAIDKLEMASSIKRVHAPTYTKLMGQLMQTALSCDAAQDHNDPLAMLEGMQAGFFELLTHDPEYAVGPVAIELAGKRAEISYSVGVKGVTASDASIPLALLLPQKAVAHAEARAHLGLIDELAKIAATAMKDLIPATAQGQGNAQLQAAASGQAALMARTMIDQFVEQGYLVREGNTIRATFDSVAGVIKLNGKPMALPALIGAGGP